MGHCSNNCECDQCMMTKLDTAGGPMITASDLASILPLPGVGSPGSSGECGQYNGVSLTVTPPKHLAWDPCDDGCQPSKPYDAFYKHPLEIELEHGVDYVVKLYTPIEAKLHAVVHQVAFDAATDTPLDDAAYKRIRIGKWTAAQFAQLYPGLGTNTTPAELGKQVPWLLMRSIWNYREVNLLNHQNNLSPWVLGVDLSNATDGLGWTWRHDLGAGVVIKVEAALVLKMGGRPVKKSDPDTAAKR